MLLHFVSLSFGLSNNSSSNCSWTSPCSRECLRLGSGNWDPRNLSYALVIPAGVHTHTHTQLALNHLWWPQSFQLYRLSFHSICASHMCVSNMANVANPHDTHTHSGRQTMGGCICSGGPISTTQIPVWPANTAAGHSLVKYTQIMTILYQIVSLVQ